MVASLNFTANSGLRSPTIAPINFTAIGPNRNLELKAKVNSWGAALMPNSGGGALTQPVPASNKAPLPGSVSISNFPTYVRLPSLLGGENSVGIQTFNAFAPTGSTVLQVAGVDIPTQLNFKLDQSAAIKSALNPSVVKQFAALPDDRQKVLSRTMMLAALRELQTGIIKPNEFATVVRAILMYVQTVNLPRLENSAKPVPGATAAIPGSTQAPKLKPTKPNFDPTPYLEAVGVDGLTPKQLKVIEKMLKPIKSSGKVTPGASPETIIRQLQAGWRPFDDGVARGNPGGEQTLRISARSAIEIAKSQVLGEGRGITLIVVSNSDLEKYQKTFLGNKSVRVIAGNNKEDPINDLVRKGTMRGVGRIVAVGAGGAIDTAKGLGARFEEGRKGSADVIVIPTITSTTTLATPFYVLGIEARVAVGQAATRVIVPIREVVSSVTQMDNPARREKAFDFTISGGFGDLQGVISQQLSKLYAEYKSTGAKLPYPNALAGLRENKFASGSLKLNEALENTVPDVATNKDGTSVLLKRQDTLKRLSTTVTLIASGLFEYGNEAQKSGNPGQHLQNMVGWEHEFFNATNGKPLGKKINHGVLVAMGTLLQAQAYGQLTGDYSVYNALVPVYRKMGIPTSAADLKARNVTDGEIASAIQASVGKNRLSDPRERGLGGQQDSLVSAWNKKAANGGGVNNTDTYLKLIDRTFP
jgi:hypothetical protein